MNNGLEILKDLGLEQIHHETHISKEYVKAILNEDFDAINSVQFIGFISILEREYEIDLSELKAKSRAHYDSINAQNNEPKKVFVVPKKNKNYASLYIIAAIVTIVAFLYYIFVFAESQTQNIKEIDNIKINNAQKQINDIVENDKKIVQVDINKTIPMVDNIDKNETKEIIVDKNETKVIVQEKKQSTLRLVPKHKIWAGYINIKTNQKYQKVFRKTFDFDTKQDWLLLFGAGTVKLEVDGKLKVFSSKQNMRFKYIDGKLTKIKLAEFKSLNKGRKW